MKKILFISFIVTVFIACKKNTTETSSPVPAAPSSPVKIKTYTAGANISNYTYDAQGRVVLISRSNGAKDEYEYSPGLVTRKIYNSSGVYQYSDTEELNADGYTKRTTRSNAPGNEDFYFYNADQKLTKQIVKSNGNINTFDYFWSNGNLDSIRISNGSGVWVYTQITTYYTDKPNVLSDAAFGEEIWGKNSKNLEKSAYNHFPDGSSTNPGTLNYDYDAQGRVTKKTSMSGNNIFITLYSY